MGDLTSILQCPVTCRPLAWSNGHGSLQAENGPAYPILDGIVQLLPEQQRAGIATDDATRSILDFYQNEGWTKGEDGLCADTRAFVDMRPVAREFSGKCIARLNKYFSRGGEYLLDAGSGPIPQDELLAYGEKFQKRVCVDLSGPALRAARSKLGDRGVFLQADLTSLPLKTSSMDAVTCNHVIYQIPADKQRAAFHELWRVLKPGGVGVIVYWWLDQPLTWRIERLTRLFVGKAAERRAAAQASGPMPELYHHPHSLSWFQAQNWPFSYRIDTFRVISNAFTRRYVSDDWRGRAFLNALFSLQTLAPEYCGRYGLMPAIVIHKNNF